MFIMMTGCEKTTVIDSNTEPAIGLITQAISIESARELKMSGEIKNLNKEEILDMGFILYEIGDGTENPKEISLGKAQAKVGPIEYLYSSSDAFQIGKKYAYCIYVRTPKAYYKGQIEKFSIDLIKTEDDADAKIHKVIAGNSFELKGEFSQMNQNITLSILSKDFFNEVLIKLPYQIAKDGKSLKIQAPGKDVYHGKQYEILLNSQDPNGENSYKRVLSTIQILARLDTPKQNELFYGDELPITGLALPYEQEHDLKIIVEGKSLPFSYGMKLSDFGPFNQSSLKWSYDNGNGAKDFPEPLQIKTPQGDQINLEQTRLHPFQLINLRGIDFKRYFGTTIKKITIGSREYTDVEVKDWGISLDPQELSPGSYDIKLSSSMFDVKIPTKLHIKAFDMTSVSNTKLYPYEEVTIKGSFIKGEYYMINPSPYAFETITAESETELKYKLGYLPAGSYNIELSLDRVGENNQKTIKRLPINILNPILTGLSTTKVRAGESFILKGKGLAGISHLFLGNYVPEIIRHTNEEIEVRVQYFFLPGKYPITLVTQRLYDNTIKTDQIIEIL